MRRAVNSPDYHVPIDGFSQIVEVPAGTRLLYVSGLTSRTADGSIVGVGDPTAQMRQIFENLTLILASAGATLDDVVSIRTYVTDITVWDRIEPVWHRHWGDVWPASTLVQITRLFDERQLIELEATVAKKEDR
ncbi:MAG: Rid family hydrolase [Acidimicrobiia bacterium]|nr:Rid family hydrolase [Acidimicrobiia bacterium]MDH4305938.1 Rid family hydrolase [Acidimicrobiia bacterium]MDH5294683.1 Rid family hydrolase [Acidimicrobiia bacterium]